MEEADKVSSSAPDEAPRDIAMNEAAAAGPARGAEEEVTGKSSPSQTTEITSDTQTNGITSAPQTTEDTGVIIQTNEVTSSQQITEEITPPISEVTGSPQPAEESVVSPVSEVPAERASTETVTATDPVITDAAVTQTAEESVTPHTAAEVTNPPRTEAREEPVSSSSEAREEEHTHPRALHPPPAHEPEPPAAPEPPEPAATPKPPAAPEAAPEPPAAPEATPEPTEPAATPEPPAAAPEAAPEPPAAPEPAAALAAPEPPAAPEPLAAPEPPAAPELPAAPEAAPEPAAAPEPPAAALLQPQLPSVLELLYWRDVRSSALAFGSSLFVLLSLTVCSIISVLSYAALTLLTLTLAFRIYKGVLQAVQKSDEGHPFKWVLEKDVSLSSAAVQRHSEAALSQINAVLKELRRLFLVEDLIDSLKFAVLLWIFTHVGAWFNGLTLLILGLVGAFSVPLTYEKHQTQIDQVISAVSGQIKDAWGKIQAKVPGAKKKPE